MFNGLTVVMSICIRCFLFMFLSFSLGDTDPIRGCGVPVEQVRLAYPSGDVVVAGSMQLAFIGGSDAVRVRWYGVPVIPDGEVIPVRVIPYVGFLDQSGHRLLNVAKMTKLIPGNYKYEIIDDPSASPGSGCSATKTIFNGTFTFGTKAKVVRYAVFGDMGVNFNSPHGGCFSSNDCAGAGHVKDLLSKAVPTIDAVINIGDLAYAANNDGLWDDYGREISNISANLPWMTAVGNHEWGPDSGCECGTPYAFRFPMPSNGGRGIDFMKHRERRCHSNVHAKSGKPCPGADDQAALRWQDMAYSFDLENVRVVIVSTQHGINPGSGQFDWLKRTLTANPLKWQVIMGHIDACFPCNPLYPNTEGECYCWPHGGPSGEYGATSMEVVQRIITEQRLPADLVLAGHTHEYYVRNCTRMPNCVVQDQVPLVVVGGAGYGPETAPGDAGHARPGPPSPLTFRQCSHAPYGFVELEFGVDAIEVKYNSVPGTGDPDFDTENCRANPGDADTCPPPSMATGDVERCTPASFTVRKTEQVLHT